METYQSTHTGAEIDSAVDKALGSKFTSLMSASKEYNVTPNVVNRMQETMALTDNINNYDIIIVTCDIYNQAVSLWGWDHTHITNVHSYSLNEEFVVSTGDFTEQKYNVVSSNTDRMMDYGFSFSMQFSANNSILLNWCRTNTPSWGKIRIKSVYGIKF